jgi:biotin operon repressor
MAKRTLLGVDGFTPLFDGMARDCGLVTAAVYGRVWRYCQHDGGVCFASLDRIGGDLGINRATVQRHIAKLVTDGYIQDTTPGRKNHSHSYQLAKKSSDFADPGVVESSSGVAENNTGVAESHMKRQEETNQETKSAANAGSIVTGIPSGATVANATSRDNSIVDGMTDFFDHAVKAKTAAAIIRKWKLPVHLEDICIEFASVFGIEADGPTPTITARSKSKWLGSAAQLYEIRPTHAELIKARDAAAGKYPIAHPGAAVNTIINLRAMNPKVAPLTHSAPVVFRDKVVNDDDE